MKSLMRNLVITIISIFGLVALHYWLLSSMQSEHTGDIQELQTRVFSLEKLTQDTNFRQRTVNQPTTLLWEKQIDILQLDMKNLEFNLKKDLSLPLSIGIPATLIAFLIFALSLYKFVYDTAIKEAQQQVRKTFSPPQAQIKAESRIMVLSKEGVDDSIIMKLLTESGFTRFGNARINEENQATDVQDWSEYDLVIFNNFKSTNIISIFIDKAPHLMILWFKGERLTDDLTQRLNITSATFTSQLYGNLMNMLDYQRSIRKFQKTEA